MGEYDSCVNMSYGWIWIMVENEIWLSMVVYVNMNYVWIWIMNEYEYGGWHTDRHIDRHTDRHTDKSIPWLGLA